MRSALQAGLDGAQIECVAARQTERVVAGDELIDAGPAPGPPSQPPDVLLERVHSYLITAISRMFAGARGDEYIGLARLACDVGDDAPQARVAASAAALLDRFERYSAGVPQRDGFVTPGVQILVAAATVTRTPDVPLPEVPDTVDLGERETGAA
jgi:hypothetical protein